LILYTTGFYQQKSLMSELHRQQFNSMGCPCEIVLYSEGHAERLIDLGIGEVNRLDNKYSHYQADSLLKQYEQQAKTDGGALVDNETAALLDFASTQNATSDGLFDITTAPLGRFWEGRIRLPTPVELTSVLACTGWNRVHWQRPQLKMQAGVELDLGGIVKEYAADRVALLLKRAGVRHGLVDLGGDLHVIGPHPDGRPWHIGIRDPVDRENAIATISVSEGGLASSGDYERCTIINGRRLGHIINPQSGWPVDSFSSVSVLAVTCLLAGSLSTLAMLKGVNEGAVMLAECGFPWLAFDSGLHASGTLLDQSLVSSPQHTLI
jgi:thiamine biosynthesis lipoprotein